MSTQPDAVEERKGRPESEPDDESRGCDPTEYSLFNDPDDSDVPSPPDADPQAEVLQDRLDRAEQLLYKKQAQKKQLAKSAAKDKARRDKHIAMMQTLQQHQLDIAREEEDLARIQADIKQAEEEDYMAALARSSKLSQQ